MHKSLIAAVTDLLSGLLFFEEHDGGFEAQVEKNKFGIAVLFYLSKSLRKLVVEALNVFFVDVGSKPHTESFFLFSQIHHVGLVEVADKILPEQSQGVQQETFLHLATDGGKLRCCFFYRGHVARNGSPHHLFKECEEVMVVIGGLYQVQSLQKATVGNARQRESRFFFQAVFLHNGRYHFFLLDCTNGERLATARYGRQ